MNDDAQTITTLDTDTAEGAAAEAAAESIPTLPVRAGEVVKITPRLAVPRTPSPVYHIKVASLATRAAFQRDVVTRCGDYPDDAFLLWALRRAIREGFDGQESADMLADLDQIQAVVADTAAAEAARVEALQRSRELEIVVTRRDPRYADLIATRSYYKRMMPLIALQHFLVGWDNGPTAFKRIRLTPEEVISAIPEDEYHQLSTAVLGYLGTVGALAKN